MANAEMVSNQTHFHDLLLRGCRSFVIEAILCGFPASSFAKRINAFGRGSLGDMQIARFLVLSVNRKCDVPLHADSRCY